MNKIWWKTEAYLKWVLIGAIGSPFSLRQWSRRINSPPYWKWCEQFPTNRERIDERERERGSIRERDRAYRLRFVGSGLRAQRWEVESTTAEMWAEIVRLGIRRLRVSWDTFRDQELGFVSIYSIYRAMFN